MFDVKVLFDWKKKCLCPSVRTKNDYSSRLPVSNYFLSNKAVALI